MTDEVSAQIESQESNQANSARLPWRLLTIVAALNIFVYFFEFVVNFDGSVVVFTAEYWVSVVCMGVRAATNSLLVFLLVLHRPATLKTSTVFATLLLANAVLNIILALSYQNTLPKVFLSLLLQQIEHLVMNLALMLLIHRVFRVIVYSKTGVSEPVFQALTFSIKDIFVFMTLFAASLALSNFRESTVPESLSARFRLATGLFLMTGIFQLSSIAVITRVANWKTVSIAFVVSVLIQVVFNVLIYWVETVGAEVQIFATLSISNAWDFYSAFVAHEQLSEALVIIVYLIAAQWDGYKVGFAGRMKAARADL